MRVRDFLPLVSSLVSAAFISISGLAFSPLAFSVNLPERVPQNDDRYFDEREVVIRTFRNFRNHQDVLRIVGLVKKFHFTTITVQAKQDEDDPDEVPSGTVFYKSQTAPMTDRYKNFDVLADIVRESHRLNLKIQFWMPQFHDSVAASKPNGAMKSLDHGKIIDYTGSDPKSPEYFANPLSVDIQDYEMSLIQEVTERYNVDGIMLDWLRFDDYPMDLSDSTRILYKSLYGVDPIKIDFSQTGTSDVRQWNDFRSNQLAVYVKRIRKTIKNIKPKINLGMYILPPEFSEVGQDSSKMIEFLDHVNPMAYYNDFEKPFEWICNKLIPDVVNKVTTQKTQPTFSVFWSQNQFKQINSQLEAKYSGIRSVSFFKYTYWDESDFENSDKATLKIH